MTKEPTSTRAAGLMTFQLGADLKREWATWCRDHGLIPGQALRSLVEKSLAEGVDLTANHSGGVRAVVAMAPDYGSKIGREVQFTPSENSAVEAAAMAQGFGFQEWVIAAVRAALANAPCYGQTELEVLAASNANMAQIAIELAALRREDGGVVGGDDDVLASLESEVRRHVEAVSVAMAQGAQRWQLKI